MPTDTFTVSAAGNDGGGFMNAGTWAGIASGTFTARDATVVRVQKSTGFNAESGWFRVDTSSIDDAAVITAAQIKVFVPTGGVTNGDSVHSLVADYYDAGGEPTTSADWILTSSPNIITPVAISAFTTNAVNTLTVTDFSGISKTGFTGIRFTWDEQGAPGGFNIVDFNSQEAAASPIQLLVTYSVGQTLAPSADSVDGNWTDQAGGTSLFAAIDESTASDSDYIRSELSPSTSACRVKLTAGGDPSSSTGHKINWRAGKDTTGGQTIGITVKLYQGGGNSVGGGTLIASFTRSNVDAFTDYVETLSGGQADSITNYGDLYLEFSANAT